MHRICRGIASGCLTAVAFAVVASPPALAATATSDGDVLSYTAAAGETNHLAASQAAGVVTFHDTGATVTAGAGCSSVDAHTVTCPVPGGEIQIDLGNRGDQLAVASRMGVPTSVFGGRGADTIDGGPGRDHLFGEDGSDTLHGGGGADSLEAGSPGIEGDVAGAHNMLFGDGGSDRLNCDCSGGANTLDGGSGADRLFNGDVDGNASPDRFVGGPGVDAVIYLVPFISSMTAPDARPVFVTLDGVANDGRVAEGDNVERDIEVVAGGWGADRLVGNAAGNVFRGGPGQDSIAGLAGRDRLAGGRGPDIVRGGRGADSLWGGRGFDNLFGGRGVDSCSLGGTGAQGGIATGCE